MIFISQMKIEIHNKVVPALFAQGRVVFMITDNHTRSMILTETTREQYEMILYRNTHPHQPVLFLLPLPQRIAALYGCLNFNFRQPRASPFTAWYHDRQYRACDADMQVDEEIMMVGNREFRKWFTIHPYVDSIYGVERRENDTILLE